MSKLFKFWRYRLEIKLRKLPDDKKVEFLANKLIKELNVKVRPDCECFTLWVHNKELLRIDSLNEGFNEINCKYTGK